MAGRNVGRGNEVDIRLSSACLVDTRSKARRLSLAVAVCTTTVTPT